MYFWVQGLEHLMGTEYRDRYPSSPVGTPTLRKWESETGGFYLLVPFADKGLVTLRGWGESTHFCTDTKRSDGWATRKYTLRPGRRTPTLPD